METTGIPSFLQKKVKEHRALDYRHNLEQVNTFQKVKNIKGNQRSTRQHFQLFKRETSPDSEGDACDSSASNSENMSTEELDIANHLNEGNTQFKLFTGSSLLKPDDERLTGLVDEEILQEIQDDTDLTPPIPEYVVRYYDAHNYFKLVTKLDQDLCVRRIYTVVPIPTRSALLQEFLAKSGDMYQWTNAVITLVKMADEKQKHYQ